MIRSVILGFLALCFMAPVVCAQSLSGAYLAGKVANTNADYRAAIGYFNRALEGGDAPTRMYAHLLFAQIAAGQFDAAIQSANAMKRLGAQSDLAIILHILNHVKSGAYDKAGAELQEAKDKIPEFLHALAVGWVMIGQGKMNAALEYYQEIEARDGLAAYSRYHRALALASVGDLMAAKALLAGDGNGEYVSQGGGIAHIQLLAELGDQAGALNLLNVLDAGSQNPGYAQLRRDIKAGRARYDYVRNPREGIAEMLENFLTLIDGNGKDMQLVYGRLIQYLRPDSSAISLRIAQFLHDLDEHQLAIESYMNVPSDDALFLSAEIGRAGVLADANQPTAAIEVLRGLSRSYNKSAQAHYRLGDMLRQQEQFEDAARAYMKALDLIPNPDRKDWHLLYSLGISHERLGDWPKAQHYFDRALALNPDQPYVLNYLGYSLVEMQRDLNYAEELIERAASHEPESAEIADSLGWVRYRLGKFEAAITPLEHAVELLPSNPIINDHLGDAYWKVGRLREANYQWRRALSFLPTAEVAARIRLKLAQGLDQVLLDEAAVDVKTSAN